VVVVLIVMPGYLHGFIEKKHEIFDDWEFVGRLDPLVGSQGAFKYLVLGTGYFKYFKPFPYSEGFPEDITVDTKDLMCGVCFEEEFEDFVDNHIGEYSCARSVELEEVQDVDWDKGISEENLDKLKSEFNEDYPDNFYEGRLESYFKLVDLDDNQVLDQQESWYEADFLSKDEIKKLVNGKTVETDGKRLTLELKTRRDHLPESWFRLLHLMEYFKEHNEKVRFIFYRHG